MRKIAFLSVLVFSVGLQAWEVSQLRGDVEYKRQDVSKKVELNQKLRVGDLIKTGKGARVLLTEGDSKLWLGQNTVFKLKEEQEKKSDLLQFLYGKMRAVIAPKQAEQYRYKFKAVVAGVRGTEFFAQTNEDGDRLCTLEGEVEVFNEDGEVTLVPEGKGVLFSQGDRPKVSDNSSFLVDQWVAETSFVSDQVSIQNFYDIQKRKHSLGESFYWGLTAWVSACDLWNGDYRSPTMDISQSCLSTYFSPFFQYGKKHQLFLRPALNTNWNNVATIFDDNPTTFGRQQETITLAEAYAQSQWDSLKVTLGYQEIEWNEGILLSRRKWSPEPMTYLAFRSQWQLQNWGFDFLAIDGDERNYALDGINQISMLGLKVDLPKQWGNIYVLYANYPGFDSPLARNIYHEREVTNFGFYRRAKKKRLDYKVSTIYQKHSKLARANRVLDEGEGLFFDLEWGWNIPTRQPVRFSFRGLYAGKDFAPIQNDYYILGISPIFRWPSNIIQLRSKIEWQFKPNHLLSLEYLNNEQIHQNGFIIHQNTTEDNLHIGDEIDLIYQGKFSHQYSGLIGFFVFFPGSQLGPDPASGLFGRLEYNF